MREMKEMSDLTLRSALMILLCVLAAVVLAAVVLDVAVGVASSLAADTQLAEDFVSESRTSTAYLAYPSRCFSCERELPPELRYAAQPTKCFDCEREAASAAAAQASHPTKCFDCE